MIELGTPTQEGQELLRTVIVWAQVLGLIYLAIAKVRAWVKKRGE
jgi:hypothetical protein